MWSICAPAPARLGCPLSARCPAARCGRWSCRRTPPNGREGICRKPRKVPIHCLELPSGNRGCHVLRHIGPIGRHRRYRHHQSPTCRRPIFPSNRKCVIGIGIGFVWRLDGRYVDSRAHYRAGLPSSQAWGVLVMEHDVTQGIVSWPLPVPPDSLPHRPARTGRVATATCLQCPKPHESHISLGLYSRFRNCAVS